MADLRFVDSATVVAHVRPVAHEHSLKVQLMFSTRPRRVTYLMKAVTWLTMCTEAACSSTRVGKRPFTEAAMVLQSWAVFPAEEQAVNHTE